jgi:hypothetical protein
MASIVNMPADESVCENPPSPAYTGFKYIEATNYFGGTVVDICSEDWAAGVQDATTQVVPFEEWELTYTPLEDTLIVFVDYAVSTEWTYDPVSNVVSFVAIPPEGAFVEIGYVIDYHPGDDDDSSGS